MEPGHRLSGRYRLVGRLTGGPDGEVWRAWDESLNRSVAVRLPASCPATPGRTGDGHEALRQRIVRAVKVAHPAFVTVYDCDVDNDGDPVPFVVTVLLDGESLARRIARGPLPAAEALDCCAQVAAALSAAHKADVAHGALGPDKIFLTPDGVRVVDLGIAEPPGADAPRADAAGVDTPGADADVRALGQVLAACLEAVPPGDVTRLPEEVFRLCAACRSPRAGERPSAARAAEVLRDSVRLAPVLDDTGATLVAPLPEPLHEQAPEEAPRAVPVWDEVASKLHRRGDGGVLLRVAVTATLLAVSLATVLLIANRGTLTRALPWDGGVPTASASAGPATSAPGAQPTVPVPVVYETLGRLQPIVDSGQASGRIRSDVAVDLNNSITNLRNDLAAGRTAEAARNLRLLREKIDTRLRERALDESVAAQMTHVLASTPP